MDDDEVIARARATDDLSGVTACELLTAAEIQAATGIAPGPPQDETMYDGQLPMCHWPSADGTQTHLVQILLSRSALRSYDEFLEQFREQLGPEVSTEGLGEVERIGDFGVWMDEMSMLQVHDDGRLVQVAVELPEGRDDLAAAKKLTLEALDRLR